MLGSAAMARDVLVACGVPGLDDSHGAQTYMASLTNEPITKLMILDIINNKETLYVGNKSILSASL